MVTTADPSLIAARDAASAGDAARATWGRAAVRAMAAVAISLAAMLASTAIVHAQPGTGDALVAVLAAALALAGWRQRGCIAGAAALRLACSMGVVFALGSALGVVAGSPAAPWPGIGVACLLASIALWRLHRPLAWRMSDTFLCLGGAVALASLVAWGDALGGVARLGTGYPAMRPITSWAALAVGSALWASHQGMRRLGWCLLGAAGVPLLITLLGKFGMPTPSAALWSLGLLPTPNTQLIGNYSDSALACAFVAVALRLRDPRREQGVTIAVSRGLGVAIASVSGMAVIGLLATIDANALEAAGTNISLGASVALFMLGAAIAVDRAGGLRDGLLDASPLVVTLMLGALFWWGTTGDRDAFERRAAAAELAQLESLLHQDLEHRASSVARLSFLVDALGGDGAQQRFARHVNDLASHGPGLVFARAYTRDGTALAWGRPLAHEPVAVHGGAGEPHLQAAAGGWWVTVPGDTGTAAFIDLAPLVRHRVAANDGAPMRVAAARADGLSARSPRGRSAIAARTFNLDGHPVTVEVLPDANLRGFMLSRTAVVGALSVGLLASFVLFLYELARSRANALVVEGQRRLQAFEELARAAGTDGVTGLARFSARSSSIAASLDRDDPSGWLILIDLDAFGSINDALGHEAGDDILRVLAQRLVDERGTVGELLRFGGEGFALVGHDDRDIDTLREAAERFRHAIGEPVELASPAQLVKVTASIGIARMPEHGTRLQGLLRSADLARLSAKRAGRNQTHVARVVDAGMQRDRLAMTAALRDAIERDGIRVAYQPIVDADERRIIGFEALARWHHPNWGDVSPAQFIPLAEASGLMERLGEGVMRTACARLAHWHALGFAGLSMSVNVSPSQLGQGTLPSLVAQCLRANGLPPHALTLEVTESMLIEDVHATAGLLGELKRLGVKLALDDFGTGYSSLAYLQRLPLDILKIDRSFVRNVVDGENDRAIIRMIMALSEQMQLQAVAEGVEDEAQVACLGAMGCKRMQGFLFARPCFADEATELLASFNRAP